VPVVNGAVAAAARPVIARIAAERGAPLVELDCDFFFDYAPAMQWPGAAGFDPNAGAQLAAAGTWAARRHQAANAAVAVACVERLREAGLPSRMPAWQRVGGRALAGRLEVLAARPGLCWIAPQYRVGAGDDRHAWRIILARAPAHAARFRSRVRQGVPGMLRLLAPQFDEFFLTRFGQNARAVRRSSSRNGWEK